MIEDDRSKDMCPICKTDRYLSPNMVFLINPECYHKICESCVDRIFSLGPAPCPYPKCGKILRKNKFKRQVFDDLVIEREIDIRKRVNSIYNKTEEDFESLESFNSYLEDVENIVFNLTNNVDVEQTTKDLNKYEEEHKIEILEKNMRESQKNADFVKYQESIAQLKHEKMRIQQQMELEDLEYQRQQKQVLLDKLASNPGGSSEELIAQSNSNILKRSSLRKRQFQQLTNQLDQRIQTSNPFKRGRSSESDEVGSSTPFTPFKGDRDLNKRYTLLDTGKTDADVSTGTYHDPYVSGLAKNKEFLGAGWRLELVFERALDEAFMGMGCFIDKEKELKAEVKLEGGDGISV
ncbi:RNA polymerase II transcription factor B subunit 3 [[Candida] railenensis]|uniref:RNA polymerase II transcription factor B subunit 3 n=1 Tax=[Candida] railenensis TaxID=45579 RepID=A0A9P0QTM2_9ASCO|nr:RNA polymerase II transcription factor B subunit 3 [[Candida] railenensis]